MTTTGFIALDPNATLRRNDDTQADANVRPPCGESGEKRRGARLVAHALSGAKTMDSFEWNKIAGAVLATALFVMVVRIAGEAIYHVEAPEKQGYIVEGVEEHPGTGGPVKPAEEPIPDFAAVIPTANAAAGEQVATRCVQCHTWNKGGPNKIGPNLFGIIGRVRASHAGFSYSPAMQKHTGSWSYEDLYKYIHQPAKFIPGNKMAFAGVPKPQDRLNLIAFMRTWADSPAALPAPRPAVPAPAGAPGAPAAGSPGGENPPGATPAHPSPSPNTPNPGPAPGPAPH
jgi:cytochrome c